MSLTEGIQKTRELLHEHQVLADEKNQSEATNSQKKLLGRWIERRLFVDSYAAIQS